MAYAPVETVDDAAREPWSLSQKGLLALAALAFCVDGLANQSLGLALPALIHSWGIPREAFAPLAAVGLMGVAVGATGGGLLGDVVGRRRGLIGSLFLFGLTTALAASADGLPFLMVSRLLSGVGIGAAIPNGAALVFEFTPPRHRNLAIGIAMTFIAVGGIVAGLLGSWLLPQYGWRALFLVCGLLPVLLALILLFSLPESPDFQPLPVRDHLERASQPTRRGAVFGRGMRVQTLALWTGFFFCLLASYTFFSWVPTLLMGLGFDLAVTSVAMAAFNSGGMTGSVVSGCLINRVGSKPISMLLGIAAVVDAVALGLVPPGLRHEGMALCMLFAEGCAIGGLHNALYTLAAHIYPASARATGVGAAAGIGRIGAVLSSFTGALSLKFAGPAGYFILVAVAAALCLVSLMMIRDHIPARARR